MADSDRSFQLGIFDQFWLEPQPELDPCPHGRLRIGIKGIVVFHNTGDDDVSMSKTALSLARTLLADHTSEQPVAPRLIHHGCGFASDVEVGCEWGADWHVTHRADGVHLSEVTRYDGAAGEPIVRFPDADVVVPRPIYERQVAALAQAVLDFAARAEKKIEDDFDRSQWLAWQSELRDILDKAGR